MMGLEQYEKCFYWRKPKWIQPVNNTYEYELTENAPPKAQESYRLYKEMVDEILEEMGLTPYDGIIIDF